MVSGIYCIKNIKNNKIYIGQAIDINNRINRHIRELKNNKHINKHLQNSWNKYGKNNFTFSTIINIKKEFLNDAEKFYINILLANNRKYGYNKTIGGEEPPIHYNKNNNKWRQDLRDNQEQICKEFLNTLSIKEICKKYSASEHIISQILKTNNINPRDKYKRNDVRKLEDEICSQYLNGISTIKLSDNYDCSVFLINKILRQNDISIRKSYDYKHPTKENIYNYNFEVRKHSKDISILYSKFLYDTYELGIKYDCSSHLIEKILKENNTSVRSSFKGHSPTKGSGLINKISPKEIYLKLQNQTAKDIGDEVGGGRNYIYNYLKNRGTTIREFKKLSFAQTSFIDFPKKACLCLSTGSCLMNCPYCFNKELKNKHYLSADVANVAIDKKLKYITAISVTGAEPLLNPELDEILKYAKSKGLKTKIDTSLKTDIVIDKNIFQHLDYMNISIKNLEHLQYIDYIINWIIENYDTYLEFNLVYHPQYISKTELKQINEIIKKYDVPLVLVQMDIDFMDSINDKVSKKELIRAAELFDNENIYLLTKEFGRENI